MVDNIYLSCENGLEKNRGDKPCAPWRRKSGRIM